jgi:tetratricopeptide (TPR) repeat protein
MFQKARESLEKAAELSENHPVVHYYLGRLAMIAGDDDGAMAHFMHSGVAESEYGHLGMALLYAKQDRPMLADSEFEKVKALAGDGSGEFWQEYANYLVNQGRFAEAKENIDKILEKDPGVKLDPGAAKLIERIEQGLEQTQAGSTAEPAPLPGGTAP